MPIYLLRLRRYRLCAISTAFLLMTVFSWGGISGTYAQDISHIRKSVIGVTVVSQIPDYSLPWNPGKLVAGKGAGFVVSDNRILTNAHIVSDARLIMVHKEDDSRNYEARVKFIAHDCDLAMLEVLDETFFAV